MNPDSSSYEETMLAQIGSAQTHAWTRVGTLAGSAAIVEFAPSVDERYRCACRSNPVLGPLTCMRRATQEDFLCDQCRIECSPPVGTEETR